MRKRWLIGIVLCLGFVLSACGTMTLEEKVEKVQKANTITIQDVIDLMELEGLEVEKLSPDSAFETWWPNGELLKINGTHYLALQSFEENLYEREIVIRDTGWYYDRKSQVDVDGKENVSVSSWIGKEYLGYEDELEIAAKEFYGKNIVAIVVYDFPISTMSEEETQRAIDCIDTVADSLHRVFDDDINHMFTEKVVTENEKFKVALTLQYYQTGVTDKKSAKGKTYYDMYTRLNGKIVCSDSILEQYQGEECYIIVEPSNEWSGRLKNSTMHTVLDDTCKEILIPNVTTEAILLEAAEGMPSYQLTIKVGDLLQTISIDLDSSGW